MNIDGIFNSTTVRDFDLTSTNYFRTV